MSWPSIPGDNYIVQYRPSLDPSTPWVTLTNSYPADWTNRITYFVHSNVVQNPNCGGSGGGSSPAMMMLAATEPVGPMAMPADGSGSAAPVAIYPPGFDFSNFLIFNPSTAEWASGAGYSGPVPLDGPQPPDGGSGGGSGTNSPTPPDPGFYQVVKVGIHLFGITNGQVLSGLVNLPIEFGNPNTNQSLESVYFSSPTPSGYLAPNGTDFPALPEDATNTLTVYWDTTQMTNGPYEIQLGATLTDGEGMLDYPVTVVISNSVWFPNEYPVAGEAIYMGVQSIYTNGSWHMDFYDDQSNLAGSFDGPVDGNGYCAFPGVTGPGFSIGITDSNGNQYPSAYFDAVITLAAVPGGPPQATVTNREIVEPNWFYNPTYTVLAYHQLFPDLSTSADALMAMVQAVWQAQNNYHPNTLGTGDIPFELGGGPAQWATFLAAMGTTNANLQTRDLFYFGHGNRNTIGPDYRIGNGLTRAMVRTQLGNAIPIGGTRRNPIVSQQHPYRFVFLDGCLTGGGHWASAFGIPEIEQMDVGEFTTKRGLRPRAFLGWTTTKIISIFGDAYFNDSHADFISHFYTAWTARAADGSGGPANNILQAIQIGQNYTTTGAHNPFSDGWVLYGTKDLVIDF